MYNVFTDIYVKFPLKLLGFTLKQDLDLTRQLKKSDYNLMGKFINWVTPTEELYLNV